MLLRIKWNSWWTSLDLALKLTWTLLTRHAPLVASNIQDWFISVLWMMVIVDTTVHKIEHQWFHELIGNDQIHEQ